MRYYDFRESPIRLFGAPLLERNGSLERLPESILQEIPELVPGSHRTPGARVCFRTDSRHISVRMELDAMRADVGMSIFACQSAAVFYGNRPDAYFAGLINPSNYDTLVTEKTLEHSPVLEDITVYLPRNEYVVNLTIGIDDDAVLESPTPYTHPVPVVFYGSSITEGGCCTRVSNAYNALVCRWLDTDYINLGFSGLARGDLCVADYINTLPMSVFVYDYDHNAPSVEHLANTHEPFFLRIREKHPDLPVIMMSKPDFDYGEGIARREVIRTTYDHALAAGDRNVYFLDGETFYGNLDREVCTVDTCHPNDLGMYRMARAVYPVLKRALR